MKLYSSQLTKFPRRYSWTDNWQLFTIFLFALLKQFYSIRKIAEFAWIMIRKETLVRHMETSFSFFMITHFSIKRRTLQCATRCAYWMGQEKINKFAQHTWRYFHSMNNILLHKLIIIIEGPSIETISFLFAV